MTSFIKIALLFQIALLFLLKAEEPISTRHDTSDQNNQTENEQISINDQNQQRNTSQQTDKNNNTLSRNFSDCTQQTSATKNNLQRQLVLSLQNNTQITTYLIQCNHKYDTLLSKYTILNDDKTHLETRYIKLQAAHDKYIYGKCDTHIEILQNSINNLQIKNENKENKLQEQFAEIKKYEQLHESNKKNIKILEKKNKVKQNRIESQIVKIQKENKQYKKEMSILINGFSLHENSNLKHSVNRLNNTLIESIISLRDSKLKISEFSHELGECNVEWGSCEQKYNMCETATKVLQKDIGQQKQKFILCNNVTKECKKKKKELKDETKYIKNDLNNCTNTLQYTINNILIDKCWIIKKYKMDFIYKIIGLCIFIIVLSGVIIYIFIQNLEKDKSELLQISKQIQKERNELEKELKNVNKNMYTHKEKYVKLNQQMAILQLEKETLIQKRDALIKSNKNKDEQMTKFALLQIEQQKKQRQSVGMVGNENADGTNENDNKNDNDNGTDSNGSWSEVSGGNNNVQVHDNKKANK
eukprot:41031_1